MDDAVTVVEDAADLVDAGAVAGIVVEVAVAAEAAVAAVAAVAAAAASVVGAEAVAAAPGAGRNSSEPEEPVTVRENVGPNY